MAGSSHRTNKMPMGRDRDRKKIAAASVEENEKEKKEEEEEEEEEEVRSFERGKRAVQELVTWNEVTD